MNEIEVLIATLKRLCEAQECANERGERANEIGLQQVEATNAWLKAQTEPQHKLDTYELQKCELEVWQQALRVVFETRSHQEAMRFMRLEEAAAFVRYSAMVGLDAVPSDLRYFPWSERKRTE